MRWVLVFIVLPINILCQQYDPQIQKHIKPDFYKLSELLTSNGGCKFLNKDSTSFTGTAYKIEYISDYYFLSNNTIQDTTSCRIKIIAFKNGFKDGVSQIITGKMPMVPQAAINMSDVRDVAKIHVLALENKNASGKRFIVTTENPYKFQEMAEILKSNGYDKVSTKLAPNFLLNFMGNFNREARSMRAFIGKTYNGDVSSTMETFEWKPISFEKTVLDTAKSVNQAL